MAPLFAIIRYALLETFFCIPILPKTDSIRVEKKCTKLKEEYFTLPFV